MISLLLSSAFAFVLVIFATPVAIAFLGRRNIGQFIQSEVEGHMHKQGVPTMGGIVVVIGAVVGYLLAHFKVFTLGEGFGFASQEMSVKALLALFALVGMAFIGFADDFAKFARKRNEGLSKRWKFGGQLLIAATFAWGAAEAGVSTELSFARPLGIDLGPVLFFGLVLFMLTATANGVNLTDGLDGLVAGSSALVFGSYVLIAFWQSRDSAGFYEVEGALDLAVFAAAVLGAALAFLWWNAAPAKIIMGDTGSHALGGAMAAMALLTNTQLLLVVIGGLYVMETVSVILQVISFRGFGKRMFLMAPIHHHFELKGWPETTVIIRFWILTGIMVAIGVGLFYGDWVSGPGSLGQ